MLPCGRPMYLFWVDVESLLMSVAVVKDTPECDDWMFSDLNVSVNEFMETNKIFYSSTQSLIPKIQLRLRLHV